MGAPKTGKSALVNQFLWEAFLADYRPTVEEFNWVEYGRADQPESNFLLQLIDSSGSRDFLAMRHLYYRIGDAFMVVYAANDAQSYAEALAMLREISQQNCKDVSAFDERHEFGGVLRRPFCWSKTKVTWPLPATIQWKALHSTVSLLLVVVKTSRRYSNCWPEFVGCG